jgi:hypothetical protein
MIANDAPEIAFSDIFIIVISFSKDLPGRFVVSRLFGLILFSRGFESL